MNACGQHTMAAIGFQGMSLKSKDGAIAPALQVLLGGGNLGSGQATYADKILKIPSRRGPEALRLILDDYLQNGENEFYSHYYQSKGKMYFYDLLKELSDTSDLQPADYIDWGSEERYTKAIGVGECAGVIVDLVSTLLLDAEEKLENAKHKLNEEKYAHAIYFGYSAMVHAAKALLVSEDITTNSQASIIALFDENFVDTSRIVLSSSFADLVYQIHQYPPSHDFAHQYVETSAQLLQLLGKIHTEQVSL